MVKQRELGVTPASVVRGPVSIRGQDAVYPKPAFLSTQEHLSPVGSVGAVAGNIPGVAAVGGFTARRPGRLSSPACPSHSKSNLVQRMFLIIYKLQ